MTLLMIGTTELLLIGGLALLLFGGKKLPEMMRGLGQGVREFKKGVNSDENADASSEEKDSKDMKTTPAGVSEQEATHPSTDKNTEETASQQVRNGE